jgi:hypothetical protein
MTIVCVTAVDEANTVAEMAQQGRVDVQRADVRAVVLSTVGAGEPLDETAATFPNG